MRLVVAEADRDESIVLAAKWMKRVTRQLGGPRSDAVGENEHGLESTAEDAFPLGECFEILVADPVLPHAPVARRIIGELSTFDVNQPVRAGAMVDDKVKRLDLRAGENRPAGLIYRNV